MSSEALNPEDYMKATPAREQGCDRLRSLCNDCGRRVDPWSEVLRKCYQGCNILMDPAPKIPPESKAWDLPEDVRKFGFEIKAEGFGTGWIMKNGMAVNDQLITREVWYCPYYRKIPQ